MQAMSLYLDQLSVEKLLVTGNYCDLHFLFSALLNFIYVTALLILYFRSAQVWVCYARGCTYFA